MRRSKFEIRVSKIVRQIFPRDKLEFNVKPKFLINPETLGRLELDIYIRKRRLAIEVDGIQHYEYSPYFHKSVNDFFKQIERDQIKEYLCEKEGVNLIRVPFDVKDIRKHIEDELIKTK